MKKSMLAGILCVMLAVSALSFAESTGAQVSPDAFTAAFDGFTVVVDQVSYGDSGLSVGLSMLFADAESAERYVFSVPLVESSPEVMDAFYRDGAEPGRVFLLASLKTVDGEPFLPESAFESVSYGDNGTLEEQPDGTWRIELWLLVEDFVTEEEGLMIELWAFDPHGEAPYTGEAQQTLYVEMP